MRLTHLAAGLALAVAVLPACAAEDPAGEETGATEEALETSWAEIDEDATPVTNEDIEHATSASDAEDDAREAEDDGLDGEGVVAPPSVAPPVITAPAPLPAACAAGTSLDLTVYYERGAVDLLKGLSAHAKPCSRYFVAIPKVAASDLVPDSQLHPRRVVGEGVHAYGSAFRATAEVHWGSSKKKGTNVKYPGWKSVEVVRENGQLLTKVIDRSRWFRVSWYLKGVLFRQRMAKAGYLPQAGDTWHVNELESMWTRSPAMQKAIRELVHGLSDGDPDYDAFTDADPVIAAKTPVEKQQITDAARMTGVKGTLFIAANGKRLPSETTNAGVENALKQTLRHRRFWADMAKYVERWGQERYVTAEGTCLGSRTLEQQAEAVGAQLEDFPLAASRAPRFKSGPHEGESTVGTALFYLGRHYVPVINTAWRNAELPGPVMRDFVAAEVHAARAFANEHRYSDGRIGVYFRPKTDETIVPGTPAADAQAAENARLGDRTALALNAAYDGGQGRAVAACGPQGAAGCSCAR